MLKFKKVELSDINALSLALERYSGRVCDYSPGNAVFWRNHYDISYHLAGNSLVLRYGNMGEAECFSYPVADDPSYIIKELISEGGAPICLCCLTEEQLQKVSADFEVCEIKHSEDWDDYLYDKNDIVSLAGRKFSGQRNHINKFKKLYPEARFETITKDNAQVAKKFCIEYFDHIGKVTDVSDTEREQLIEQFDNWEAYSQLGGMLISEGRVVGISVGEIVGDTLIIHTEKADTSFDGAYPMLVNCFAREFAADDKCLYINREEDCGIEGLRISKRSYHPIEIIKKYAVIIKELS